MEKLLWHVTMSLDGYIAPGDNSTSWMFGHGRAGAAGSETMHRTGAILSGRRGFDLGIRARAVATVRQAAGGKDVGVFGADVARQCLRAGLLDELVVHLVPVLLGGGVRPFDSPGSAPLTLRKTGCDDQGQVADLRFEVVR